MTRHAGCKYNYSMIPKSLKIRSSVLLAGLFLALSCGISQAQFVINGFGLSGSNTSLDTMVAAAEDVHIILSVNVPTDWVINGVGYQGESRFVLTGYFYREDVPFGDPATEMRLEIDSTSFVVNTFVNPQLVKFRTRLPQDLATNIRSMQMRAAIIGEDGTGNPQYSEHVVSFLQIHDWLPVSNPVDTLHRSYLSVDLPSISRPIISSPTRNQLIGRLFALQYDQPLDAVRRTLVLDLRETLEIGGTSTHRMFLADTLAGEDKLILINGLNLGQTDGVDSLVGLPSLNHNSRVTLKLYYEIQGSDSETSDTAFVEDLRVDFQTETPILTEPHVGSESPAPDIRVIYRLNEQADSVQLIFAVDSLSQVEDPFSPHIITLIPSSTFNGEHYLILDGTNIGTGGQNVLHSSNGPDDALVEQALYNVSLSVGDLVGNPPAVVTNEGYIWPEDLTTVPPRILAPATNTVDNNTFWVQIELPETPLIGSVYITFTALPPYPGSPHTIFLGNLASSGITGLFLNSQALDASGLPVTEVEGGNSLHHDSRYLSRVFYQDHYGNDEAGSTGRLSRYDGATELPVINFPVNGDSLAFAGTDVIYSQIENATPGSLKLILEQTGGPEVDLLSPHTMYLSDLDSGVTKSVTIHPAFIGIGDGIDSVTNAGSLISRGQYKLTLSYQDVLLNAPATTFVRDLYFPSGSSVSIRGSVLSTEVVPGASNVPLMQFGLSSLGESALRGIRLGVESDLETTDIIATRMILWSSVDSLLQVELDEPLDTLDYWFNGTMQWDSISLAIEENERHIIISGTFPASANPAHAVNLVLYSGNEVNCGGDPVTCAECPIGMPDVALPVMVSSMFVSEDTTFSALVVNWIVESEYNVLGFRLWRSDNQNGVLEIVATYSSNEELYGRGTAASAKRYRYVDRGLRNDLTYTYSIDVVSMDGLTIFPVTGMSASGTPASPPSSFILKKVYPNPFNSETTIEFVVPYTESTELTIYNLLGQPVRELINAQLAPSVYRARWDGRNDGGQNVPTGLYIVRLKAAGKFDATQKILLVR
ncbi:MAG: T9SS type A sorting domain-containing protein [bacterium]|nr:T9SS type A sorting domain-containing protein [bacterium]